MNTLAVLRPALTLLFLLSLVTGAAYPLLVTGIAQLVFPARANGSVLLDENGARGSRWIGQPFDAPGYFWSRPSATTPAYNAAASSGSNLGPSNPALVAAVEARIRALREADPDNTLAVPIDLVTSSASGLDPHISVAAALYQVRRVAAARSLPESAVRRLVLAQVEGRELGVLGEPRVNVLALNLALGRLK